MVLRCLLWHFSEARNMGDTENDKKIEPTEDDKEEELEKKPSRYVSLQPQKVMAY